jgi:hypothetical protein
MVSGLVKQAKVKPPQDNRRNMVNKHEKSSNFTKQASQQSNKFDLSRSNKRPLKTRKLSMREVHTSMQEGLTSRMTLATR